MRYFDIPPNLIFFLKTINVDIEELTINVVECMRSQLSRDGCLAISDDNIVSITL